MALRLRHKNRMRRIPVFPAIFLTAAALLIVGVYAWVTRLGQRLDPRELLGTLPSSWEEYRATMTAPPLLLVLMALVVVAFVAAGVYSVMLARRSARTARVEVDSRQRPKWIDRHAA